MPTIIKPTDLLVTSGTIDTPLTDPSQLVPGIFLTGPAWRTVRRVVEVDRDVVVLELIPPNTVSPNHIHSVPTSGRDCECGLRRQAVRDILPLTANVIRTYVLTPSGPLRTPDPYTVYAGGRGPVVKVEEGAEWNHTIPVIPLLSPVWSLPAQLRELIDEETRRRGSEGPRF